MLTLETVLVAEALKSVTGADKITTDAPGNVVRQLHVHIVARSEGDPNWPGPVWGFGAAEPRSAGDAKAFTARLLDALTP